MKCEACLLLISALVAYSSGQPGIETLHAKMDTLKDKLSHFDILGFALKVTDVDKNLKDLNNKVELLMQKFNKLEEKSHNVPSPTRSNVDSGFEKRIEDYCKKFTLSQIMLETELKKQFSLSELLKPSLEEGMKKMFSKLDKMHSTLNPLLDDLISVRQKFDLLEASMDVTGLLSKDTQEKVEVLLEKQDREWTNVQKQLRDISVEIRSVSNDREVERSAISKSLPAGQKDISLRIRNGLSDLQKMEPKMDHFLNIAQHLKTYMEENEIKDENIPILNSKALNNLEFIRDTFVNSLKMLNTDFQALQKVQPNCLEDFVETLNSSLTNRFTTIDKQFAQFANDVSTNVISDISQNITNFFANVNSSLQMITEKLNVCSDEGETVLNHRFDSSGIHLRSGKTKFNKEVATFLRQKLG